MAKITYVTHDDQKFEVDAASGTTIMENAIKNSVPGIEAECGGACACATCHIYIDDNWIGTVGPPEAMEEDMLDFAWEQKPNSRLSCQVKITDDMDGVIIHIPEKQA